MCPGQDERDCPGPGETVGPLPGHPSVKGRWPRVGPVLAACWPHGGPAVTAPAPFRAHSSGSPGGWHLCMVYWSLRARNNADTYVPSGVPIGFRGTDETTRHWRQT